MRIAVIVAWRPKNFPQWNGRLDHGSKKVPRALNFDAGTAPYTGIHLASLFPRHWDITLIHEMVRDVPPNLDVDAVFISTMDFCAPHARNLAREFRSRGVSVIVGGLFPTLNPGYFSGIAHAVVMGEAEPVMAALIADLERNRLQPLYRAPKPADLSELPIPRFELIETAFGLPMAYEATRGCPFTCSYCVLSAIRLPYRRRPIANVIRDLSHIPSHWSWLQKKLLVLWDNNLGADRRYFPELCEALVPLKRIWGTESSVDTITPESARLLGRAGCKFVYIGLESLAQESLANSNKRHNKVDEYKRRIQMLHDNGVHVMSIFLLGLDGDSIDYARRLPELVDDIRVDLPVFSFASPIQGTPFHKSLQESGRLVPGDILYGNDGAHLLYRPRDLSPDELEVALFECMRIGYSPAQVARRIWRGFRSGGFWGGMSNFAANVNYRAHQQALSRTGLERIRLRGAWPGQLNDARVHELLLSSPIS